MGKLGVFGGSFNPVHNGHVIMALSAREAAGLDRLLVVPAATPPHKQDATLLPPELRLACLRAAFDGIDGIEVDPRELERDGVSYTVDTLEELRAAHPSDDLAFLIGGDSVSQLPSWRDTERLARLSTFLWIARPGSNPADADASRAAIPGLRLESVPCPLIEISASDIRHRMRAGLPLHGYVPTAVASLLDAR